MKSTISNLRLGQVLKAQVVDRNRDGSLIVNFEGDLLRVVNLARVEIPMGKSVVFTVTQLDPLQFQIQSGSKDLSDAHFDRLV